MTEPMVTNCTPARGWPRPEATGAYVDVRPVPAPTRRAVVVLLVGGLILLALGMLLGEFYAIWVSHQRSAVISLLWQRILSDVALGAPTGVAMPPVQATLTRFLSERGAYLNAHATVDFLAYLCFGMAVVIDRLSVAVRWLPLAALVAVIGSALYTLFVMGGFYLAGGLTVAALACALIVAAVTLCVGVVVARLPRSSFEVDGAAIRQEFARPDARRLLVGGVVLVLCGAAFGLIYSLQELYVFEPERNIAIRDAVRLAVSGDALGAKTEVARFWSLTMTPAIRATAHSHMVNFGVVALFLCLIVRRVRLRWLSGWSWLLLASGFLMPIFIYVSTIFPARWSRGTADTLGVAILLSVIAFGFGAWRWGRGDGN